MFSMCTFVVCHMRQTLYVKWTLFGRYHRFYRLLVNSNLSALVNGELVNNGRSLVFTDPLITRMNVLSLGIRVYCKLLLDLFLSLQLCAHCRLNEKFKLNDHKCVHFSWMPLSFATFNLIKFNWFWNEGAQHFFRFFQEFSWHFNIRNILFAKVMQIELKTILLWAKKWKRKKQEFQTFK